jgi:hypothetical protein
MKTRKAPQRLVSEMQMLRIRVAAAESELKVTREQAREAKRRRKEAKRNAQVARKRFKQSKAELSELREALSGAEARLFRAGGRTLARKTARAKRMAHAPSRAVKTVRTAQRLRSTPAPTATNRKPARTVIKPKGVRTRPRNTDRQSDTVTVTTPETGAPNTFQTTHAESPATPSATTRPL